MRVGDVARIKWWWIWPAIAGTSNGVVTSVYEDGGFDVGDKAYLPDEQWMFTFK